MIGAIGGHAIASGAIAGSAVKSSSSASPLTATTYRFPGPIARYATARAVIAAGQSAAYYVYVPSGGVALSGDAIAYRQTRRTITVIEVHGTQTSMRQVLGTVPSLNDLTGRQPTLTGVGHG